MEKRGSGGRGEAVVAPTNVGPLFRVPPTGGEAVAVTRLEAGQSHRFPQFQPDGRHFIYTVFGGPAQGVYASSLDGRLSRRFANADATVVLSTTGFLFFLRQTSLFAQAFDFKRQELSGNPFPVAEQAAFDAGSFASGFSVTSGIVAYRTGSGGGAQQLTWLDRSGKNVGVIGGPDIAHFKGGGLSPDGKRGGGNGVIDRDQEGW